MTLVNDNSNLKIESQSLIMSKSACIDVLTITLFLYEQCRTDLILLTEEPKVRYTHQRTQNTKPENDETEIRTSNDAIQSDA